MRIAVILLILVMVRHRAYVNIEIPISIYISHGNARRPFVLHWSGYACFRRYILKLHIAFIKVKFVSGGIGSKKNIRQPVVIDVANGYSATVVIIHVIEYTQTVIIRIGIGEMDAGFFRVKLCE